VNPLAVSELVDVVGGELDAAPAAGGALVDAVSIHSRRVVPGAAFFALAPDAADAQRHAVEAAANGATIVIVGPDVVSPAPGFPMVRVDEPLRALQRLAAWWRRQLRADVVAVVGSVGKTITKDCLVHILGRTGSVFGTPGSYNSQLGVALALLACPPDADVAVIEAAVSDPGEMARHLEMIDPHHVILTSVGSRWRSHFADRTAQIDELLTIVGPSSARGWVLLGEPDGELVLAARRRGAEVHTQHGSALLPTFSSTVHVDGDTDVDVSFPSGAAGGVRLGTPSDEIVADIEIAISAAHLLGAAPADVLAAVDGYSPVATRVEIWRSPSGVTIVRDVATPDPIVIASGVRTARRLAAGNGRTKVVLGEAAGWDVDAAERLGEALDIEQVDEVLGLRSPQHEATAAALLASRGRTTMTLFDAWDELRAHLLAHLEPGDVCLVQSESSRPLGDLASRLIEAMAPTRLYIDLSAMEENVLSFRRVLGAGVRILAMVKAVGYGTDAVSIGLALQEAGVTHLGVANVDEGIALRKAGINMPVVVFLGNADELEKMLVHRLTPVVYSPEMLEAVRAAAPTRSEPIRIHLEVDSGMHRTGLEPAAAVKALRDLAAHPGVSIEGLMTHLACADDPAEDAFTQGQLDRFDEVLRVAGELGLRVLRHAAATAGALRFPAARYDMVRIGLGLYGLQPSAATARELDLAPVASLVSRVIQVHELIGGERVGYGGTFTAPPGGARIGVVPVGYADGVPRSFSNVGHVVIAGVACPIAGTISMDSMTVDLSASPDAMVGSDVLIYGRQGDRTVPLEAAAAAVDTIAYEVMTRVGPRVQRILTRH
jgi:alanine racemase